MGFNKKRNKLDTKMKIIYILAILLFTAGFIRIMDPTSFRGSNDSNTDNYSKPKTSGTGAIEVTVRNADTLAFLQNALVSCYDESDVLVDSGTTNSSGMFTITGLEVGWHTVNVSKEGYIEQSKDDFIDWEGDDDFLSFDIVEYPPDSGHIRVSVRDDVTSNIITNALVECYNSSGDLVDWGYTDINGIYRITGLYIGAHIVNVSKNGYIEQSKNNYINWNGDDDYLFFYMLEYPPDSGHITVTVRDSVTGNLISSILVECYNSSGYLVDSGYTGTNGIYRITGLYIGVHTVNVSKNGYIEQSKDNNINWNGDDDNLTFYIVEYPKYSGYIELQVNDDNTMLPINNSHVECFNKSSMELIKSGYTDSLGFYNITGLAKGDYLVNVSYNGYVRQSKSGYINWSGAVDYLTFDLVPNPSNSGYIEVNVHDADSLLPLENAIIEWYYLNATYIGSFSTATDGYYIISGLAIGSYIVNISRPSYFSQSKEGNINWNGDHTNLDFLLQASSIFLTSPTNSDDWEVGNSHNINWTVIGSIATMKIELYKSDVLELVIESSISNDGGYSWLIPTNLEEFDQYQIKVSDASNPSIYDICDYFQIHHPPSETPSPSVYSFNVALILGVVSLISMIILSKKLRKIKKI